MRDEINYEEIDELCIPMVKYFNSIGLTTKFSCQGHDNEVKNVFDIMFEDYITDEAMIEFLELYSSKYDHSPFLGGFYKWYRKLDGKIASNWMYSVSYGTPEINQSYAEYDLKIMQTKRIKMNLYHRKVFWLDIFNIQINQLLSMPYVLSKHVVDHLQAPNRSHNITMEELSTAINIIVNKRVRAFECGVENGQVLKFATRVKLKDKDVSIVFAKSDDVLLITTYWVNQSTDLHRTLDKSKYQTN